MILLPQLFFLIVKKLLVELKKDWGGQMYKYRKLFKNEKSSFEKSKIAYHQARKEII